MFDPYLLIFAITGGLSMFGSSFLMFVYLWNKELRSESFKRVFWMSLCDFFLSLKFWLEIITQTPVSMERNRSVCLFSAIVGQFFGIATISWYFVISVCVYCVFQPHHSRWRWVLHRELFQHVYVWGLASFGGFLPWWSGTYGDMDDGTQCWIPGASDPMKLTLILPLYIYLLFAAYLLIYVVLVARASLILNKQLKERMLAFVSVFLAAWIWPALAATWDFISPGTLPLPLHFMDVGAICGSGFFNFCVWITHPAYRDFICQCLRDEHSDDTYVGQTSTQDTLLKPLSKESSNGKQSLSTMVQHDFDRDKTETLGASFWATQYEEKGEGGNSLPGLPIGSHPVGSLPIGSLQD